MKTDQANNRSAASSDTADHVTEARARARRVLGGEAHLGGVDDWRTTFVSARDTLILIWLAWVSLHAFGNPPFAGHLLVALAVGLSILVGLSTARSTYIQVQYHAAELDRERSEIHNHFEHERDEVRALYEAKGFREPLLGQIVDTLCADDDRLLKVMMEEELGLSMHHMNHPLIVGVWNFGGSAIAGLALALPILWLSARATLYWVPVGGSVLLAVVSGFHARASHRRAFELWTAALIIAFVSGGVIHFLSRWLAQMAAA